MSTNQTSPEAKPEPISVETCLMEEQLLKSNGDAVFDKGSEGDGNQGSMDTKFDIPEATGEDISPNKDGGILKTIVKEGTGTETPSPGSRVFVHYVGTFLDGTKFDSSRDRGKPFEFNVAKGSVIKAWDIGVVTMKKGEIARFVCASEYAYGKKGSPPKIPADTTLVFEIEAIDWQGEDLSVKKDGGIIRYILEQGDEYGTPNEGALVQVHLVGKCNGCIFEERDVTFPLGEGSEYGICDGLERAIEKLKKGEKSRIVIKSRYAYRDKGNSQYNIPPNTDIEYEVFMKHFEKSKESWALDCDGKLEQAKFFKERGTNYFKDSKYSLAVKMYKRLITYVEHSSGFEAEKEDERKALLLAGHLNLAMCYLKLSQHLDARGQCDKALQVDPNNEKGLFRRGQAYLGLGEPEIAKRDFEAVLKLEPKNTAAASHIILCNKKLKEQKTREKMIYANMFEKFAQRDKAESSNLVNGWWDGETVVAEKDDGLVPKIPPKEKTVPPVNKSPSGDADSVQCNADIEGANMSSLKTEGEPEGASKLQQNAESENSNCIDNNPAADANKS